MYIEYHGLQFKVVDFVTRKEGVYVLLDNGLLINCKWVTIAYMG